MYWLTIFYTNGSQDRLPFKTYAAAGDKWQYGISYSGGRVRRVELASPGGGSCAIWDASWDDYSKARGLEQ